MKKNCQLLSKPSGFSLIELMITIVIIGILASIGYPSYINHVNESRRAEGTSALLTAASAQERFYTVNNNYASQTVAINITQSDTGLYNITTAFNAANTRTYTLTAQPSGWNDVDCGSLTLTNAGIRGAIVGGVALPAADVADCWDG